jgi:hypothetical protein
MNRIFGIVGEDIFYDLFFGLRFTTTPSKFRASPQRLQVPLANSTNSLWQRLTRLQDLNMFMAFKSDAATTAHRAERQLGDACQNK